MIFTLTGITYTQAWLLIQLLEVNPSLDEWLTQLMYDMAALEYRTLFGTIEQSERWEQARKP